MSSILFFFSRYGDHQDLHSFPTRRSSDLDPRALEAYEALLAVTPDDTANRYNYAVLLAVDRKSTRLNSSHSQISYAVFCLKKKKTKMNPTRMMEWLRCSAKQSPSSQLEYL